MKKWKVLNLYAGIGGNRKLWADVDVTAVEINPEIAAIYQDFFPNDKVIVADAHQYLLDHYKEFDFIWSSPPCPSHSRIRRFSAVERGQNKPIYPDMSLYEEIIFLDSHFDGKWVVENVISYYKPLISPVEIASHYYWSNFYLKPMGGVDRAHNTGIIKLSERKGFNISNYKSIDKRKILRNCVEPEMGLYILNYARNTFEPIQEGLFEEKP